MPKQVSFSDLINFNGQTKTLLEWSKDFPEIPIDTIKVRLVRGWTVENAFTRPVRKKDVANPLLHVILEHVWTSDDDVKKLYFSSLDRQSLIDLYKSKRDAQKKYKMKKTIGKTSWIYRDCTDDEMAERGCGILYKKNINYLIKKGFVERDGNNVRRLKNVL